MTAQLVGAPSQPLIYDPRTGQYRKPNGQFASRGEVLAEVDQEIGRQRARLQGHSRLLANGQISLADWQARMGDDMKLSALRMAMLAAGGKQNMGPRQWGQVGQLLRQQYRYLQGFAADIAAGKLSQKQIMARTILYSGATKQAFHLIERNEKFLQGFMFARRTLDPQAEHCKDCIALARPNWTPTENVTPPGSRCRCAGNCRCRIQYSRFNPDKG